MSSHERLDALKRAAWRVKVRTEGRTFCRACKGLTYQQRPYCARHMKHLSGFHDLTTAIYNGGAVDLELTDELIDIRSRIKHVRVHNGCFIIGQAMTLRMSHRDGRRCFVLRLAKSDDEIGVFESALDAMRAIATRQTAGVAARNRWASVAPNRESPAGEDVRLGPPSRSVSSGLVEAWCRPGPRTQRVRREGHQVPGKLGCEAPERAGLP